MGSKEAESRCGPRRSGSAFYNKEKLVALNRQVADDMLHGSNKEVRDWGNWGTPGQMKAMLLIDDAGVKNWSSTYEGAYPLEKATPSTSPPMSRATRPSATSATAAPWAAARPTKSMTPKASCPRRVHPVLNTNPRRGLSSNVLNSDRDTVVYINYLTNEYGFDAIAFINTLSWALECYEKGVLTREQLNGIDLRWGDPQPCKPWPKPCATTRARLAAS